MLAPRHPAVAPLPRAYRTALHLRTCANRLSELARFFRWLDEQGLTSLGQVDAACCEAYLTHRRYVLDEYGGVIGSQSPATRRAAALVPVDLVNYRELFTADQPSSDLVPWGGATASAVAEMPNGREENKTQPVEDKVMQPMLAAALYLLSTLGPHAVTLAEDIREADRVGVRYARKASSMHGRKPPAQDPQPKIAALLAEHERMEAPLPLLPDHHVTKRIAKGWAEDDPLVHISLDVLARRAGFSQFSPPVADFPARAAGEDAAQGRSGKRIRARCHRRRDGGRGRVGALDTATAPAAGRCLGRHRPHRRSDRSGGGLRDAFQRADGTDRRLPSPAGRTRPRPDPLPTDQQGDQGPGTRRRRR
ncbi:putative hypothetical protein [Streptomyces sp. NBRC 110611]|uniref:hypothetical protein n=1 Tax=Streptomyces sp. NBRC 110611 TaxID=1621259 RepID=UPI0008584D8F|nr:hypothetical protein [Streptomyces sp. NBRC 110611]GAU71352.1 putative hypothetical protein [Streptomyces sp. NBRC 110611]